MNMKTYMPAILMVIGLCLSWLIFRERDEAGEAEQKPQELVQIKRGYTSFDDPEAISLSNLLSRPRSELAALNAEYEQRVIALDKLRDEGKLLLHLVPAARIPLAFPIWQEAQFSQQRDMLVPPYLPEGQYDSALALHLARHGDIEAARKLVDPVDADIQAEIARYALPRNYPVEWTRLVALILDKAHLNLASGDVDAAKRIASIHSQLKQILGKEAADSQLGSILLPRGRTVLFLAVEAWRKANEGELVKLAEPVLVGWGQVAGPTWPPISRSEAFAHWTRSTSKGLLLSASSPLRARDVLGLGLPGRGLQAVVGLSSPSGNLQEILAIYGPEVVDIHEPRHLSYWWEEQKVSSTRPATDFVPDVLLTHANGYVGPIVRIAASSRETTPIDLPRDFGLLSLDRSFDHNRRLSSWATNGGKVTVTDPKVLANLRDPLTLKLTSATLERGSSEEILGELRLNFASSEKTTLVDMAAPFWQTYGAGQLGITGTTSNDALDLRWKDLRTSYRLRVPHLREAEVALEIRDASGQDPAKRLQLVRARDDADRKARWDDKKTLQRLVRKYDIVELGIAQAELERRAGRKAIKNEFPGGVTLTFLAGADGEADWVVRQIVARFESNKLVEAQLRFTGGVKTYLQHLRKRCGAPEMVASLEVPEPGTKKDNRPSQRWLDDKTLVQASADNRGLELVVKDCPLEHPLGRPLSPLSWLSRGPQDCLLGTPMNQVLRRWNAEAPPSPEEPLHLAPAKESPFDALNVWFSGDKVSRVVARYRRPAEIFDSNVGSKAIVAAWSQDAQVLGWPWQQKLTRSGAIQSWSNRDDVTQIRIFTEDNDGIRLFSEWK